MLNKKHNLKSGNSKDKKRDLKETQDRKPKKEKRLMKKTVAIECFDVVPFMKQKAKKKEKERKRQKQGTKRKQKRKTRRKKERKEERERETEKEKQKKREAKKG